MTGLRSDGSAPLAGLGPRQGVPRLAPAIDWSTLELDDIKGFVLSRVDGRTTLGDIILLAPFPEAQTVAILGELFTRGVIDLPGVPRAPSRAPAAAPATRPPITPPAPAAARPAAAAPSLRPAAPAPSLGTANTVPAVPVATSAAPPSPPPGSGLSAEARARIEQMLLLVGSEASAPDPNRLLGVPVGADRKAIKRAYRELSKEFHPDRYFRKDIGDYGRALQRVFNAIKEAYDALDGAAGR